MEYPTMPFPTRWLASPQALWLLLALPLLAQLAIVAWLARRRAWRVLGQQPALQMLSTRRPARRLLRGLLTGLGLLLVGVAVAGPQWGREETAIDSAARDLVVVLDVSRSMLAEIPSRQVRAQRLLVDLASTLKQRGGHRIALVVCAAKAQLVVPLTADYDHFREAVLEQDADQLPEELRPGPDGPTSGTRLGAGLTMAVAAHDPKYAGSQVVLLVSDGDDPVKDDEWKNGAMEAKRAGISVFTIGVGDPEKTSTIPQGKGVQLYDGQPVRTRLEEKVLQEIAQRTDGTYFPVRTQTVAPGNLFPTILEAAAARPREVPPVTAAKPRYQWFLGGGLLCLAASMLLGDRRATPTRVRRVAASPAPGARARLAVAAALAWVALVLAGAAPLAAADDAEKTQEWLRLGNEAFQHKDYPLALKYYEQAEERAGDPGLVAFNKAAALYRLGRYREAELCYLRCLQDRGGPAERLLKAKYDLGTVLLLRGGDAKDADAAWQTKESFAKGTDDHLAAVRQLDLLWRAKESFLTCAKEAGTAKALVDGARHNAELAGLLWDKLHTALEAKLKPEDPHNPNPGNKNSKDQQPNTNPDDPASDMGKDGKDQQPTDPKQGNDKDQQDPKHKELGAGNLPTLPDVGQLVPLDGQDVRGMLAKEIERIENQKKNRAPRVEVQREVMDW
jgi:Ca-activated chloride channel family protein